MGERETVMTFMIGVPGKVMTVRRHWTLVAEGHATLWTDAEKRSFSAVPSKRWLALTAHARALFAPSNEEPTNDANQASDHAELV